MGHGSFNTYRGRPTPPLNRPPLVGRMGLRGDRGLGLSKIPALHPQSQPVFGMPGLIIPVLTNDYDMRLAGRLEVRCIGTDHGGGAAQLEEFEVAAKPPHAGILQV